MVAPSAWASHILVNSKSEAMQIKEKVTKLKDFQKMARKHSSCPSGSKGGDLGWFHYKQMVPDFSKKVWEQDMKTIDGFIKTGFGYHIIWVHERDE